jgi:uncharacterized protein (DUF2147 family)
MIAMKNLFVLVALFFSANAMAAGPDDILGIWMNASGKGQIQIYKEGDKYFGKIIWMKDPNTPQGTPKMDARNPDPALRTKPILGAVILRDFVYDDGEWNKGRVYDPTNGKEYKCYMKLKDPKTLSLRGYIGVSLLGRTEVWTRMK